MRPRSREWREARLPDGAGPPGTEHAIGARLWGRRDLQLVVAGVAELRLDVAGEALVDRSGQVGGDALVFQLLGLGGGDAHLGEDLLGLRAVLSARPVGGVVRRGLELEAGRVARGADARSGLRAGAGHLDLALEVMAAEAVAHLHEVRVHDVPGAVRRDQDRGDGGVVVRDPVVAHRAPDARVRVHLVVDDETGIRRDLAVARVTLGALLAAHLTAALERERGARVQRQREGVPDGRDDLEARLHLGYQEGEGVRIDRLMAGHAGYLGVGGSVVRCDGVVLDLVADFRAEPARGRGPQ